MKRPNRLACAVHTHTPNVGYEECGENHFLCPLQPPPGFLLDRETSLLLGLQAPPSSRFKFPCFTDGFAFSQEPTGPPAHSFPQSHSSQTHLHFFLPKRQTWMDDIKGLPGPSALCWVDHWGALGSLRKGGQRNVAVSDSFPWGHLGMALTAGSPMLGSRGPPLSPSQTASVGWAVSFQPTTGHRSTASRCNTNVCARAPLLSCVQLFCNPIDCSNTNTANVLHFETFHAIASNFYYFVLL